MPVTPPQNPQPEKGRLFGLIEYGALEQEINEQTYIRDELDNRIEATREYLAKISTDSQGSEPADFLPPRDAEACADFLALYKDTNHPEKTRLKLEVAESGEKLWGKKTTNHYPGIHVEIKGWRKILGSGVKISPVPLATTWEGHGFFIERMRGSLVPGNVGFESVYLCTDGKLRCTRSPGIFTDSYAVGVGTMPKGLVLMPEELSTYSDTAEITSGTLAVETPLVKILGHYAYRINKAAKDR